MKPYFLVIRNYIKLKLYKMFVCNNMTFDKIEMLSRQTKFKLQSNSTVKLGKHIVTDGHSTLVVSNGGELTIGNSVYLNEGCMISCKSKIEVGDNCKLGPGVMIFDNNHKYDANIGVSDAHTNSPIIIGKNCWIAANAIILKGTIIEDNCVIGAGSIVSGHVQKGSIVTNSREMIIKKMEK